MRRRRFILAAVFAVLALAGAVAAAVSAARLEARLTEERILAQASAMAADVAQLADMGAPIRDYTGFASAAKAFLAAERRLASVSVRDRDGAAVFSAVRPGATADCAVAACLQVDVVSRILLMGDMDRHGSVEVAIAAAAPLRLLNGAAILAIAATVALGVIGVVYFLVIADDAALAGPRAARAWCLSAAPPVLVIGAWLTAASGDAYLDRARVTADVLADRLRAAVDIRVDPVGFSGLEDLFRVASSVGAAGGPETRLQLREGRRAIVDVAGVEAADGGTAVFAGLDLSVSRAIRPRTLAFPALSIVAVVPWAGVVRAAPEDHAAALGCLVFFVFGPSALLLGLRPPVKRLSEGNLREAL